MKTSRAAASGNKRAKKRTAPSADLMKTLKQRQAIYAFVKRVYEKELSSELLREMYLKKDAFPALVDIFPTAKARNAVRQLVKFIKSISPQNSSEMQLQLAADYARLFLSINKVPPHPSESVYREGPMMQASRDEVLQTYWKFGVDRKAEFTEPEDHIAVELGFMMFLCGKAIESLQRGNSREAVKYLQAQHDFLEQHLLKWVPKLVDDILTAGRTPFYKSVAILTNEFLTIDVSVIQDLLQELKM